ncbi:folate-binding protein YgfZ [Rhodovulum sulfidophilum]|uniref:CAF17-like 4Fe-4S cluster assembly/insertion protein YgfZ n=1 Tax=Rhodovulum sulfidophilum TaxID=35806 RepID=UPI001926CC04|nr:folate-binding protein YgfZ [Rhodovulum sulfidophilum]MBL3583923.1 folate-binding protein YgfZ [Rhodovulum sulfidophilum]
MTGEEAADRTVLAITGADREKFLQGLVTNDIKALEGRLVYAAMLTPQGKYLADFLLTERDDTILLDVKADIAEALARRLSLYKLRADVRIAPAGLHVHRGLGEPPEGALPDPRHAALGWRAYAETPGTAPAIDWDRIRVAECIPETGIELIPEESYILEAGFERLHGVDFRKGCYVGQEVTARMKHKTELRKGLATVGVEGAAPTGTPIAAGSKEAGRLFTQAGDLAIAYLRFDRVLPRMTAGAATVLWPDG